MNKPTPAERIECAKVLRRLGCVEVTRRCKAYDAPSPYAWFWQDGSESGVITARQDYEHHKATYPRMTFTPVYTTPPITPQDKAAPSTIDAGTVERDLWVIQCAGCDPQIVTDPLFLDRLDWLGITYRFLDTSQTRPAASTHNADGGKSAKSPHSEEPGLLTHGARDWVDDLELYSCRCMRCNFDFLGYKRRIFCKLCDTPQIATTAPVSVDQDQPALNKQAGNQTDGGG